MLGVVSRRWEMRDAPSDSPNGNERSPSDPGILYTANQAAHAPDRESETLEPSQVQSRMRHDLALGSNSSQHMRHVQMYVCAMRRPLVPSVQRATGTRKLENSLSSSSSSSAGEASSSGARGAQPRITGTTNTEYFRISPIVSAACNRGTLLVGEAFGGVRFHDRQNSSTAHRRNADRLLCLLLLFLLLSLSRRDESRNTGDESAGSRSCMATTPQPDKA